MLASLTKRQAEAAADAGPVFLTHGYAATTMAALADAAGLSRQGLYLIFPHKEAVFTAAVTVMDADLHAGLEEGLARRRSCKSRLVFVCERWIAGIYDLQQSNPEAKDMDDLAFPIVRQVYGRFVGLVARLLREGREDRIGAEAAQHLARVLVFAIRGFSATALDGRDMRRLAALQIDGVLGAAERLTSPAAETA
jgi:AcrR family transcriptional regulator